MPTSTTSSSTYTKRLSPPHPPSPPHPLTSAAGSPFPSSRLHTSCCHTQQFLGAGRVCGCGSHSQVTQAHTLIWSFQLHVSLVNKDVLPDVSQQSTGVCCRVITHAGPRCSCLPTNWLCRSILSKGQGPQPARGCPAFLRGGIPYICSVSNGGPS